MTDLSRHSVKPRWAPRVPRHRIRQLYESLAHGLVDAELIDDVGIGLYLRCRSILTVHHIWHDHRLPCPSCGQMIALTGADWSSDHDESTLRCERCFWTMKWTDYWLTFRHQELGPGGAADIFEGYVKEWEAAATERDKILAIDRVIHKWHWETREERPSFGLGRPTGVNLIEGNRKDVVAFLDNLSYGASSPEETTATRDAWRERWQEVKDKQAQWHAKGSERQRRSGPAASRDGD